MKNGTTVTAYIVTNQYGNRFLCNRAYSATTADVSRSIENAKIFKDRSTAASCANNINRRGYTDVPLRVVPIEMAR